MNGKQWLATGLTAAMTLGSINLSAVAATRETPSARAAASRPNIVFVLMDDTGYGELGCYGNTFNETPNIDQLASEGALFTDFYTQPVCSPSRGCLMTGNNPLRNGVTNFLTDVSNYLDPEEFETLPQMMNRAGYHTGMIGKWHLEAPSHYSISPGTAEKNHWDEVLLSEQKPVSPGDYFYPYNHIPQVTSGREQNKYLVDDMNEEAVAYIERNANKDEPFMLYLSHYATHTVLAAPNETVEYFQQKRGSRGTNTSKDRNPYLAAMLKHIDDGIGMIDDTLEELGIKDNTILILAGDNGGETQVTVNGALRGGKRQLYEGGIRDPMIFRWPSTVKPGQRISCMTSMIDFYQTFGEVAGLDSIQENTGISLLPLLDGSAETLDREVLYWTYPRFTDFSPGYTLNNQTELVEGGAIRKGNYKYLQSFAFDDRRELYDLSSDPRETTNIIDAHPDVYRELARALHEHLAADTVGKTFKAVFEGRESYRWNDLGSFSRNNVCTAGGTGLKITTVGDFLYYDTDSTVTVQAGDDGQAGLVFRANLAPSKNPAFRAYAAVLDLKNNAVELLKLKGSRATVLASAPCALHANQNYNLQVSTDSDEIKISVDDTLLLTHYDQSYIGGLNGLYADRSAATFDDLTVTGKARTRELTDQQLNLEPEGDLKIKADDRWVWFDEAPVTSETETLVQADHLLDTMGLAYQYDADSKTFAASRNGNTLSCTAGNATATLNGAEIALSAAPVEQNGHLMIPLSLLENALLLQVSNADGVIVIDSSLIESHPYNDPKIVYTPASAWMVTPSMIRRSSAANAAASLTFTGTGVELYLDRGAQAGKFDVYLDGELVGDDINSRNASAITHSLMFKLYGLPIGEHTIRVVNTGKKGATGGGTNLNINEFCVIKTEEDLGESDAQILGFTVPNQIGETVIDQQNRTISLNLPAGALGKVTPTVKATSGATVAPASGATVDLTAPVNYSVISSSGLRTVYRVTATAVAQPDAPQTPTTAAPTAVKVTGAPSYLAVGKRCTLKTTLTPANAKTTLSWTSSKPSVATVDKNGVVTGKKAGKTTITVKTANGKQAQITLTVKAPVQKVTFKAKLKKVKRGKTLNLKKLIRSTTPKAAYAITPKYKWSSQNKKLVTVSAKGIAKVKKTAKKGKKVKIFIKRGSKKLGFITIQVK